LQLESVGVKFGGKLYWDLELKGFGETLLKGFGETLLGGETLPWLLKDKPWSKRKEPTPANQLEIVQVKKLSVL